MAKAYKDNGRKGKLVFLDSEEKEALEVAAKKDNRNLSQFMRHASLEKAKEILKNEV